MFIFIKTILILSFVGSVTFLTFLLMSFILKEKLSASLLYLEMLSLMLLWFIPLWRIFPQWEVLSVHSLPQMTGLSILSDLSNEGMSKPLFNQKILSGKIGIIYCFIVVILLLRLIFQYRKQKLIMLKYSWEITDPNDIKCLKNLMKRYKITKNVQLRCSFLTKTPILLGIFHQQIILPNYTLSETQLELVLQHELIHLKRQDNIWKIYLALLKCLHWFNPIVYFMQRVYDHIGELSCDEQIVSKFNLQQRKQYSLLILELVQQGQRISKTFSGFNQHDALLKKRLHHILHCKNSPKRVCAIFGVLISLISITGCHLSAVTDEQAITVIETKKVHKDMITLFMASNRQKSIETFYWEKRQGEDKITLIINGKEYQFKALDNGCFVFRTKELSYYWNALAELPKENLPEDLVKFLF